MKRLDRETALKAPDIVEKEIEIPEWGGSVLIRTLTVAQQAKLRKMAKVNGKIDEDRLEILIFTANVIDPKFTEEDYELLQEKSAAAMNRVMQEVYSQSAMTKEEIGKIDRSFPEGAS